MKPLVIPALFGLLIITAAWGELDEHEWLQWGQNPQHTGFARVQGQSPDKQLADIVYDPFVPQEQAEENGELLVHYQVPLISKKRIYMEFKTGTWIPCPTPGSWAFGDACGPNTWNQQILNLAIGAAYTPLSLGPDGKIYTQNDGQLFVAGDRPE